ncbi:MAG: hypothetical protein C0402_11865 [Thermodesulfovibrio sp.]|nr:hypothetical protein [Thermodesulfovibrio sp.]
MLRKLRADFLKGIGRIRWFSGVLSERLNIEIAVIKLLYKSDEIDRKRNELLTALGRRVYELKDSSEKNVLKDREVLGAITEIERLEKEIVDLSHKIDDLSRTGA